MNSHADTFSIARVFLEATNINKDYLKKEADATGDPSRFQTARQSVQSLWAQEDMGAQMNEKTAQKVLNFLYLMEIRSPGFTTVGRLHAIHDLYVGNTLDTKFLSAVNSDTTPEQAARILSGAVEHQEQSSKVYSDLTPEEEEIWNRVKVYHEFDDGFKWVYAVNANGSIASHIPSNVTFKTMHHCGNTPNAKSDDQYWELRGPDGKAYLTVILTPDGRIEESKSWGNQASKYRRMIQPYVKWFMKHKVTGVGYRYDYGYATHSNYGVKDFIGDDPEFVEYVLENKPELMGNTEKRILFWQEALRQGVVTVDDIKEMFAEGYTLSAALRKSANLGVYHAKSKFRNWGEDDRRYRYRNGEETQPSVFGDNPFEVICAACDGCPFSKDELVPLILDQKVTVEEFANYDVHMLDDDMQKIFVQAAPYNLNKLINIAEQVGTFHVADDIINPILQAVHNGEPAKPANMDHSADTNTWVSYVYTLRQYIRKANPPEKARRVVDMITSDPESMKHLFGSNDWMKAGYKTIYSMQDLIEWLEIFARFPDLAIPGTIMDFLKSYMRDEPRPAPALVQRVIALGRPRIDELFADKTPKDIVRLCLDTSSHLKLDARNLMPTVKALGDVVKLFPQLSDIYRSLRPSLRLGYYCCAPEGAADVEDAVKIAVSRIRHGEAIPLSKTAFLSATGAATIMAIGKFPEIMEYVTAEDVGNYVFRQADMISYTYIKTGPDLMNGRLVDILKTAYMEYDEWSKNNYAVPAMDVFLAAATRYDLVKPGDPIFNELYLHLARSGSRTDTMKRLTGYTFYPDFPVSEWDGLPSRMDPRNPMHARQTFVETYILPGLHNGQFADNPDFLDYLVDYIIDPEVSNPNYILNDIDFRRRSIMNKVKKRIAEKVESGIEISMDRAKILNKAGVLAKDYITRAQLRQFDEKSESEIDESIVGKIDQMITTDMLTKYKKSSKFPYFVNELLRAILETYDLEYGKIMTQLDKAKHSQKIQAGTIEFNSKQLNIVSYLMFIRFSKIVDFLFASPKTPSCVAAAKIAHHSGLIEAYRMVAERYGQEKGKHALHNVYYYGYGTYNAQVDETTDLSKSFRMKITQLEQVAQGKQKYKPAEGELPIK